MIVKKADTVGVIPRSVREDMVPVLEELFAKSFPTIGKGLVSGLVHTYARSGFAPMAHPDWKFGDVVRKKLVQTRDDTIPFVITHRRDDRFWRGYPLEGKFYELTVISPDMWELVPEPDD